MTHTPTPYKGVFHGARCTCGHDTGPCVSARQADEVHAAHATGQPIPDPVRPVLLARVDGGAR